ncbi:TonB-dependent receptor [Colwellia sp. D2M02]|uniref:TonB-dependent receptor family protein n=1 Tax=Colwellia sp. D2M02 TaxID=2841562 RepID=UPI001C09587F|nr:TonB-dependent receptor [Colwellia sp. D2M02]MBU2891799.1 TonB-dependent receptor [Colwellia sp. D2M02]
MQLSSISLALITALSIQLPTQAETITTEQENNKEQAIERITINHIISPNHNNIAGAIVALNKEEIERQRPFSIKEALENIAGINVVGEDVFSTHLNIGMRGLNPRRSARTLLMEDGMPLYLAPYGDPSAHYSPPIENLEYIEVVKGSGQVLYGPQTIGGMINFVTTPVPTSGVTGNINVELGTNGFQNIYARAGVGNEKGGILISATDKSGDGIRENHQLDISELSFKGQWNINNSHTITAKYAQFKEDSNISETGLSEAEYATNPFQAPTGKVDGFIQQRDTLHLIHDYEINNDVVLSSQFYHVDNDRASFRQINGPGEAIEYCPTVDDFSDVPGARRALPATEDNSQICGGRWRPRYYNYWGIEPRLTFNHQWLGSDSEAIIGVRYHREDIQRHQFRGYDSRFQSLDFAKTYTDVDQDDNRAGWHQEHIQIDVTARSYYIKNAFKTGAWTITPGLRLEDITATTDYIRTEGAAPKNPEKRYTQSHSELLPGIGATYEINNNTTVFAGVHQGFSPARPNRDIEDENPDASYLATKPEQSTNYEFGFRSTEITTISLDTTLFLTDFDEIVVQATSGRYVNAGESRQAGLEVAGQLNFADLYKTPYNVYLQGNYTNLFLAEFNSLKEIRDDSGANIIESASFEAGNRLPYAPKHMASLTLGFESAQSTVDARIGLNYVSEQFVDGANTTISSESGEEGIIPSHTIFSLTVNYRPTEQLTLYINGQNITDELYLVSRVDGMVAGREQQFSAGVNYQF